MSAPAAIARLGPGDAARMRRLNAVLGAAFDDAERYARVAPGDDWLERTLSRETVIALVAEAEGEVVGGIVAYRLDKLEAETSEIYLYDLGVAEGWRRRGVATALIEALRAIARDVGAWVIFVQADPPDVPAVALYTGLGTREDVLHFGIAP